ncbi:hypothetical protein CNY89_05715, partial [Amaricoccus sp. HAR-UPW-R2A-40]
MDVFDIEVDETDPDKLVEIIAALEPTFGGVNLEDIKAPECFVVETKLRARMKIPVFHDDQHGTAIVSSAALLNALHLVGKDIGAVKLVCSGAGAAAIACLNLAVSLGVKRENVFVIDSKGVVTTDRPNLDPQKAAYAQDTQARTLADAMEGADVFFGLSAAGVLKPEMVAKMAEKPIILAMANPDPEIRPEDAKRVSPDCIIATGRSDYPNQVNNVLCFPFIFRGALDVGASEINEEMKLACVRAIAELARADVSDVVAAAYGGQNIGFGPDYIIPAPFDPRLITVVAPGQVLDHRHEDAEDAVMRGIEPLDLQVVQRHGRGGVAGEDDQPAAFGEQPLDALDGEVVDLARVAPAVGRVGVVAEIDEILPRQLRAHRRQHRQPAEAAVEDPDHRLAFSATPERPSRRSSSA